MHLSPQLFGTLLAQSVRLGNEFQLARFRAKLGDRMESGALLPVPRVNIPVDGLDPLGKIQWIVRKSVEDDGEHLPGKRFEGLFERDDAGRVVSAEDFAPKVAPGKEDLLHDAVMAHQTAALSWRDPDGHVPGVGEKQDRMMAFYHLEWTRPGAKSPWAGFFRHVVDASLDIAAAQPGLVKIPGMDGLFAAMAPNLASAFDADAREHGSVRGELAKVFAEAGLKTLMDNPSLVTSEKRWEPVVQGILRPLQEEVAKNNILEVFAAKSLRELIGGPVAYNVLTAISEDPDSYLKGDAKSGTAAGLVLRETLGVFASADKDSFAIRKVFTEDGAVKVFRAGLNAMSERPDLFLRAGTTLDDEEIYGRKLLSRFAKVLADKRAPFGGRDGIGPDLAAVGIDVAKEYITVRLRANASAHADSQMGAEIAAHIIGDLLDGVIAGHVADRLDRHVFDTVFSRSQAVDILKIMAKHVADNPDIIFKPRRVDGELEYAANQQVRAIGRAIAAAIANDTTGLLKAEDWRAVIVVALDTALLNPGVLFSLKDGRAEDSLAFVLIKGILSRARATMQEADGPRILFGTTLYRAICATLKAAASALQSGLSDPAPHIAAVDRLIDRLNRLAGSKTPGTKIGAEDWSRIYAYYIAHALDGGTAAVDALSDEELMSVLFHLDMISEGGQG